MPELPPDPEFAEAAAMSSDSREPPDGPGIDDSTVICGYPSSVTDAVVVLEAFDGEPLGPLPHFTKDSPEGYAWGYIGTGPSHLARSILVAVLGRRARCGICGGTGQIPAHASDAVGRPIQTGIRGSLAHRPNRGKSPAGRFGPGWPTSTRGPSCSGRRNQLSRCVRQRSTPRTGPIAAQRSIGAPLRIRVRPSATAVPCRR